VHGRPTETLPEWESFRGGSLEQRDTELLLKQANLPGDRRLYEVQQSSRLGDAPHLRHRDESSQLLEVQRFSLGVTSIDGGRENCYFTAAAISNQRESLRLALRAP